MRFTIEKININNIKDIQKFYEDFKKDRANILIFDTETDGLNIIFNKPFLISFGYFKENTIKTYTLDFEKKPKLVPILFKILWYDVLPLVETLLGHNIPFDMSMVENIGYPIPEAEYSKLSDTQFYIRLGEDPIIPKEGGPVLKLKDYVYRYIWRRAKLLEIELKQEIEQKRKLTTRNLLNNIRELPLLDEYRKSGKEKRWTKGMIDKFVDDKLKDYEDLPEIYHKVIKDWQKEYKKCDNYQLLNRENITRYAHYDIVLVVLVYLHNRQKIIDRGLEEILKEENEAIPSFYKMERAGKLFDIKYATDSKKKLKAYILQQQERLQKLLNMDITANQSVLLKQVLNEKYDMDLESTDKRHLKEITDPKVKEIAKIVVDLRSQIKWYSTYLVKWIEEAQEFNSDYIYPTYNQVGAVTGRASSPYQQFPKESLKDHLGNEIYHPRRMLITPSDYDLFYFDYNSMEMRMLAIFSMLMDTGDLNICRLFIPYQCFKKDNKYYFNENPEIEWKPSKPHDVTTKNIFNIDESNPEWAHYRALGKRANFAIIYGSGPSNLAQELDITYDLAKKLYDGFYQTFPTMWHYTSYIRNSINNEGYVQNVFGRRYYNISAHKGKNYLIQGSCADYTKKLLPEITALLKGTKSYLENYLHDEFSFRIHKTERHLIPKIKKIMEQLETEIPMTVDVEIAEKDWSNKHDFESL